MHLVQSPVLVVRWLFTNALATTVLTKQARREEGFERTDDYVLELTLVVEI